MAQASTAPLRFAPGWATRDEAQIYINLFGLPLEPGWILIDCGVRTLFWTTYLTLLALILYYYPAAQPILMRSSLNPSGAGLTHHGALASLLLCETWGWDAGASGNAGRRVTPVKPV